MQAIRDIGIFHRRWPQALRALITSRSAPEEAPDVLLGNIGGIKNVITFDTSARSNEQGGGQMSNDWIDISVPIHTGMVHWPDNPPVLVEYMLHIERGDICTVSTLSMGSHTGYPYGWPLFTSC